MDAKDIDNSLADDVLTIRGEKKQEKDEADENYHRVERGTTGLFPDPFDYLMRFRATRSRPATRMVS